MIQENVGDSFINLLADYLCRRLRQYYREEGETTVKRIIKQAAAARQVLAAGEPPRGRAAESATQVCLGPAGPCDKYAGNCDSCLVARRFQCCVRAVSHDASFYQL